MDRELVARYNYVSFIPDNFMPWMKFDHSPEVGEEAPDFPLWNLEEKVTSLSEIWSSNLFSVVEFGSFT